MEIAAAIKSSSAGKFKKSRAASCRRRNRAEKPYKGIRMRRWGKWVTEIREPLKQTRIWLGTYHTPLAAAKAHDTAVFYLGGPAWKINFPADFDGVERDAEGYSAKAVRAKAEAVGMTVDAMAAAAAGAEAGGGGRFDLNRMPDDEEEEADDE